MYEILTDWIKNGDRMGNSFVTSFSTVALHYTDCHEILNDYVITWISTSSFNYIDQGTRVQYVLTHIYALQYSTRVTELPFMQLAFNPPRVNFQTKFSENVTDGPVANATTRTDRREE